MSNAGAQRRAIQALDGGNSAITPLGRASAQELGNSVYGLLPSNQALADGISQGTPLVIGYHAETHTYLIAPLDVVLEEPTHWGYDQLHDEEPR